MKIEEFAEKFGYNIFDIRRAIQPSKYRFGFKYPYKPVCLHSTHWDKWKKRISANPLLAEIYQKLVKEGLSQ